MSTSFLSHPFHCGLHPQSYAIAYSGHYILLCLGRRTRTKGAESSVLLLLVQMRHAPQEAPLAVLDFPYLSWPCGMFACTPIGTLSPKHSEHKAKAYHFAYWSQVWGWGVAPQIQAWMGRKVPRVGLIRGQ